MDKSMEQLKRAFRKFYFKTRDSDIPPEMQDLLLEKIVNERLIQGMEDRIKENPGASQEQLRNAVLELKELVTQWKDEIEKPEI